jgi:Carboxypeptidase regulatory-like domain
MLFQHVSPWKTPPRAGYVPRTASLPLTQPFLLLLWLVMGVFPVWAQTGASLSGMVTNQTGVVLPDVSVTIKNVATGERRTIVTDGAGHYQASGLPAGRFDIRAAKQGFGDETRAGITLTVGHHRLLADLARHHRVRCI